MNRILSGNPKHDLLLALLIGAALISPFDAAKAAPTAGLQGNPTPPGDAQSGRDYYRKYYCYSCHGAGGQTGPGPRLVPMLRTAQSFTAYLRNPRRVPRGESSFSPQEMPPYTAKVISDAEVADLYAYIKSLKDLSPQAKDIPMLNAIMQEK